MPRKADGRRLIAQAAKPPWSFTKSVERDRGVHYRLKVKLTYKGEPEDFDIVVGCNLLQINYKDNSRTVKDFDCANSPLCFGTSSASQLDDALALTRAAKTFAASEGMELVVAGQSLGGGLAGLVSAIENVKSYLLAPAPFQNQLEIQATLFALEKNGVPLADLKTGTPPIDDSILRAGDLNLKNWIHAFRPQYDGVMDAVLLDRTLKLTSLESTLRDQATLYLNEGEALTSGSISTTIDAFSDHFDLAPTKINLGDGSSVSLHGPALHNLAIRTYGSAQAFDALLRNDKALRAAFLDIIAITGTIDNMRADPEGSSSRMGSSGPSPAVMENALWKTVGLQAASTSSSTPGSGRGCPQAPSPTASRT